MKAKKPNGIQVNGENYRAIVLLIHTKHSDGSPALMKHIPDDHTIELAGGEEFMIAYAPRSMVCPGRRNP